MLKYSQKLLDHAKKSAPQMHAQLHQPEQFKKTAEVTGDLIDNKIANKVRGVSKNSQQNN